MPTFAPLLINKESFTDLKSKENELVLMFVAIAAISFASCGNKNQSAAPAGDSDTTAVDTADTAAVDTAAADTAVAQ
jgi:hypothetical protein